MFAKIKPYLFYGVLAVLILAAMALLAISTPAGAGLSNDSAAYIAGARSILKGSGYSDIWLDSSLEPITHYPPLLSLSLAALGLLKIDPLRGARILNIMLFGANTALMGIIGFRMTRSQASGIWLAALFALSAQMLRVHVFAMSEPLFTFFSLLCFLFIDQYLSRQRLFWSILAGAATGLAFLTRYSALALIPTFTIVLILFQQTWPSRLKSIGMYFAGAIPWMAAWLIRNSIVAGNITNRTFQYHPITSENIAPGIYNFSFFLLPYEPLRLALAKSGWLTWGLAAISLTMLAWLIWRTRSIYRLTSSIQATGLHPGENQHQQSLSYSNVLYIFAYLIALLFSMSFFDASTKFLPRILAPIYMAFMMMLVAVGSWLWKKHTRVLYIGVLAAAILTIVSSSILDAQAVANYTEAGQGYASWKYHDSIIMADLRKLPVGIAIYTNSPPAVYLVTGKPSRVLPTPIDPVDMLARGDYQQNVDEMRANLFAGKAVLALFDTSNLEEALGSTQPGDNLIPGLKVLQKAQGDILYGKP